MLSNRQKIWRLGVMFFMNAYFAYGVLFVGWSVALLLIAFYLEVFFEMLLKFVIALIKGKQRLESFIKFFLTTLVYSVFLMIVFASFDAHIEGGNEAFIFVFYYIFEHVLAAKMSIYTDFHWLILVTFFGALLNSLSSRSLETEVASQSVMRMHFILLFAAAIVYFGYGDRGALLLVIVVGKFLADFAALFRKC